MKNIIQGFLPWILFFILAGKSQMQLDIAIITAAIAFLIFERRGLRKGFILSWGSLAFFGFMFITVILMENQWVVQHAWIISNGSLFLIAFISILVRKPFTLQYAREQVSSDKWQHPLFIKINYILTWVWALSFLFSLILNVSKLYNPLFNLWIYESLSYAATIFAIWFTAWFPEWYKERYIRMHQKNPN